jgi:hypothetical protein
MVLCQIGCRRIYGTDHGIPRSGMIRATLDWLDKCWAGKLRPGLVCWPRPVNLEWEVS